MSVTGLWNCCLIDTLFNRWAIQGFGSLIFDLTSGRCQMFMNRSSGEQPWLNAPEMNAAVHRLMFIDLVFCAVLSLVAPTSELPRNTSSVCRP